MRLESPPELIEGIKPATRKKLAALEQEIKELGEAGADHARAVAELKSSSGLPSTADRDRLQDQQFTLLQRRLELCDRAVEFSLSVTEETREIEAAEQLKKPAILDAIAEKLQSIGYDFGRSDIYWRDRAGRFLSVEQLLHAHPSIIEHRRICNDIDMNAGDWNRYNSDVYQQREKLVKTVDQIRKDALATV